MLYLIFGTDWAADAAEVDFYNRLQCITVKAHKKTCIYFTLKN